MPKDITSEIIGAERDLSHYPDIHLYADLRRQAFWVLDVAGKEFGADRLTPNQVAEILVERFEISTTPRAVGSVLGKAAKDGLVNKKTKTSEFKIMESGREELYLTTEENPSVFYIEPDKPYSAKLILFDEVLSRMRNRIWICDPYVGIRLLDILNKIDVSIEIRIMTQQVQDKAAFIRALVDFKREHLSTEVKVTQSTEIHDRYVISDTGMWLVGHSLKDLGSKETFLVRVGDDIRDSVESVFKGRWNASANLT